MRPRVICHMLSPLDGRLVLDTWAPDGSAMRKAVMDAYTQLHVEFGADAWLVGSATMAEFAHGVAGQSAPTSTPPPRPWHISDPVAGSFAIAIDRRASLHWNSAWADDGHVVVILPPDVPDSHLTELGAVGVSYWVMPDPSMDLRVMLDGLNAKLGIRTLLLEGGARINGAFLQAGLVDEISLLIWPAIDGTTGSPAIFETGPDSLGSALKLSLLSVDQVGPGAVHLRYRVELES